MLAFRPAPCLRIRASLLRGNGTPSSSPRPTPPPPPSSSSPSRSRAAATPPQQPTAPSRPTTQSSSSPSSSFKQGSDRSLWESWKSLSPRIRKRIGFTFIGISIIGIIATDYWEDIMPVEPKAATRPAQTQTTALPEDQHKPKMFGVRVVERN